MFPRSVLVYLFFAIVLFVHSGTVAQQPTAGTDSTNIAGMTGLKKVEIEASFPRGKKVKIEISVADSIDNRIKFLEKNLDPGVPIRNKAPEGTYTVIVQFVSDKEGNVSDARPLTAHGYGMEEEVLRLIKKSPRWIPATQNERMVKTYRKQTVTFRVIREKKKKKKHSED
jgi:hypothetical protein